MTKPAVNHEPTLVVGATGKTGRRVVRRLQDLGRPVRPASRSAAPAFDWNDPDGWHDLLRGVRAVYVVYYPDLSFPGAAETLGVFAGAAVDHGVERCVLLSGRGEDGAVISEDAVRAAAPDVTVLRASWFMQNFSEYFLLPPVLEGVIALPAGDVREPFVDVRDIADVAVAALVGDEHRGQTYELTGPRLLTFADVAAELTRAIGRPVTYVPVSPEEYAAAAVGHGVPPEEVGPLTELFTSVLDGRNASTTDDVERVLGRPARDFADFAEAAAATGVWGGARPSARNIAC